MSCNDELGLAILNHKPNFARLFDMNQQEARTFKGFKVKHDG